MRTGLAAPYTQSAPRAQSNAVQKRQREKSPSELGEEVIRIMLEDEGRLKPPESGKNEAPASRTFTTGAGRSDIIEPNASAARNAAPGDNFSIAAQSNGADAGPTQAMPDWLDLMSMSGSDYPGLPAAANQFGLGLKEVAAQFTPDQANSLALDWLDLISMSNSDYPGLPTFANPVSPLLRNGTKPLWNNTHLAADTQASKIKIQNVEKNPQSDRIKPKSEALPYEKRSDILSKEQDSIKRTYKEWWEKPGASEPIDPNDPAYQAMNELLTDDQRAAGLSVVKINGEYYVDVTIMINTRLQEAESDFRSHSTHNHSIYNPAIFNPAIHNQGLRLAYTAWFISQVKGGAPWDIKEEPSWEKQFGNILGLKKMSETIAYNGQVVRPENLGNLTYGYLGRSMGWPAEILYLGGGAYNQKELAEKEGKKWPWLYALNLPAYFDGSYGDGENDYIFIKQGVELYEAVH